MKIKDGKAGAGAGILFFAALFFAVCVCAAGFPLADKAGKKPAPETILNSDQAEEIKLELDEACHTQGVDVFGERLFVSCVDRKKKRALVLAFPFSEEARAGAALEPVLRKDITQDGMFHPSGLDHGRCLWVAAAHYRSFMARSKVMCLNPRELSEQSSFMVEDHIGTLAVMGERLVLMNWDAKKIYLADKKGKVERVDDSPSNIAYQDCKAITQDSILCAGSSKGSAAAVDELAFSPEQGWRVSRRFLVEKKGVNLGREGFTAGRDFWAFLPGDFPSPLLYLIHPAAP